MTQRGSSARWKPFLLALVASTGILVAGYLRFTEILFPTLLVTAVLYSPAVLLRDSPKPAGRASRAWPISWLLRAWSKKKDEVRRVVLGEGSAKRER